MYLDEYLRGISGDLFVNGSREPAFMWIIKKEARGLLGVDLGANIGYTTLFMCKKMDRVIAIEPDIKSRRILNRNINYNGFAKKTIIYEFAISDKNSSETIYINRNRPNLNSLYNTGNQDCYELIIETRTIDSLDIEPNFIKMDIEGYEIEALRGSYKTLSRSKLCKLLIEVHPQYYSKDRDFELVLEDLLKMGFNFKYVVSAGIPNPLPIIQKKYKPVKEFQTKGKHCRGLYEGIKNEDAIEFSTKLYNDTKIVRSILLVKE